MEHLDIEGQWEIPGAGEQRKTLLFSAGEGHVYVAILGRNGGTQASMVLDLDHGDSASRALRHCTREARIRKEESNGSIEGHPARDSAGGHQAVHDPG